MTRNNQRIQKSSFLCNRHPRLCEWWCADVRQDAATRRKKLNQLLSRGQGLWCQANIDGIDGPFRIDRRRICNAKYILKTIRCWEKKPYAYTSLEKASSPLIRQARKNVRKLWDKAYTLALPHNPHSWTTSDLTRILHNLDRIFLDGTLQRALRAEKRDMFIEASNTPQHFLDWRRDYPIARVALGPLRPEYAPLTSSGEGALVTVELHPSFYRTAYPMKCDGFDVFNRKEHIMHCIAHEVTHIIAKWFSKPVPHPTTGRDMKHGYDSCIINPYTCINLRVFGHPENQDRETAVEEHDISE